MASVNKAIILGNCGKDPEVRYSAAGKAVCNISIATSTRRKDKQTGEATEVTQWHRVTLYDRLAEIAGEYVKKGGSVYIEGRIEYGKYTDKDGHERNTTDIIATELQLMGSPRADAAPAPERRPPPRSAPPAKAAATGFDDMDSDIPFALSLNEYAIASNKTRRMSRCDFK